MRYIFSKYLEAYKNEGIDIWGLTPVNEPHGNGNNWESMHFSPEEETDFVQNYLGPKLEEVGKSDIKILGYDQNRDGLKEWVDDMYKDEASSKYFPEPLFIGMKAPMIFSLKHYNMHMKKPLTNT